MSPDTFVQIMHWVMAHGYIFIFLAMCIEGPTVTAAAAFGAALGHFNIFIIFGLSLLGDLFPDFVYYNIGRFGRKRTIRWCIRYFKISEARLEKIETLVKHHDLKTLFVLKFTPFIAIPGLIAVGLTHMKVSRFLFTCFVATLPRTIIVVLLGYYLGAFFEHHAGAWNTAEGIFIAVGLILVVTVFALPKISAATLKRIEKIDV